MNFKRYRLFGAALTAAALSAVAMPVSAQTSSDTLTVMSWGITQSALKVVNEEFTKKTGVKVRLIAQTGSAEGLARLQSMRNAPTIDVWMSTSAVAERAFLDKQLFVPLPADKMPNLKKLPPGLATAGYASIYTYPLSIGYRTDAVKTPITAWSDLWKPEFKGKLGVPDITAYQGRILLIAQGVGGKPGSTEVGFETLKKLKPNIAMLYSSDAQARQALAQGDVSVLVETPAHLKRVSDAGVPLTIVSPKGTVIGSDVAMIVNTPNAEKAASYINFLLETKNNTAIGEILNMAPANRESAMPASLAKVMPAAGDAVIPDETEINRNIAAWNDRFKREIAQ
ncbi:MAG: extracellular solute-binding protein [Pandoraea sp.]|nr:extracellular solute-binding protein [Pandoraea sp.]MDR3399296.1 extracellular solute-binding protein [Pandoraea sp.]